MILDFYFGHKMKGNFSIFQAGVMSNLVVRETALKVFLLAVVMILGIALTYLLEFILGYSSGGELILLLMLVGFWSLTRIFRGSSETDLPRPLWRMTERPALGYGLFVFFLVNGLSNLLLAIMVLNPLQILAYTAMTALGGFFFRSSIKLHRTDKRNS